MRILFIAEHLINYAGGSEIYFVNLLTYLSSHDHTCVVITDSLHGMRSITERKKIRIIETNQQSLSSEILKEVNTFKPDIVSGYLHWGRVIFPLLRKNNNIIKVYFLKLYREIDDEKQNQLFHLYPYDILLSDSHFLKDTYKNSTGLASLTVYPVNDLSKYIVNNNSRKYITLINDHKDKGFEIVRLIARIFSTDKFLVIRAWRKFFSYADKKQKNIILKGPFKNMKHVYNKTRILLIPSLQPESFGHVALEAMINGIPVVASSVGGLSEVVGNGGILIKDYSNPDAWVKALHILESPSLYKIYQKRAYAQARLFRSYNSYKKIERIFSDETIKRKHMPYIIRNYVRSIMLIIKRYVYFKGLGRRFYIF